MRRAHWALLWLLMAPAAAAQEELFDPPEADFGKGATHEERLEQRLRASMQRIPYIRTLFLIGGFLQLDGISIVHKQDDPEQDTFYVSSIPFEAAPTIYRVSPKQSQLSWMSRTDVGLGYLWTRFDANLFPMDGQIYPVVNQLMMRWEDYLVVGKTYSTFMDNDSLPTTLDYNGPSGVTYVRQFLARVGLPLPHGVGIDAAVEQAETDLGLGEHRRSVSAKAVLPDFTGRLRYDSDTIHLQLSGIVRKIEARAVTVEDETRERTLYGTGVSLSGTFALFGEDSLLFQGVTGKGIERYFNDPLSATGLAVGQSQQPMLVRTSGATLYYQHTWNADCASVFGGSVLWVNTEGERLPTASKRSVYASVNMMCRITPTLIAGGEFLFGQLTRVDDERAYNGRFQLSFRYLIF